MNQGQFDAGASIVEFSKIFANAMEECMKNSGLYGAGYELNVRIQQPNVLSDGKELIATVRIDHSDGDWETAFVYHKYAKKGWMELHEPRVLQDDVRKIEPNKGYPRSGTEKGKASESDGDPAYIGDDPSALVDWWGLK